MGGMEFGQPRPLKEDEIEDLIDRWAFGAECLYRAGASGCQLHAAHGYLLSQFLSSRVNKRTDQWGGPLENKSRIVFRVIEEIKKRVDTSKFLISIKMVRLGLLRSC
jgi:2,4-dienoyl-CoA reductase-like NADH-dependent reductase (Old Yellow Enzyme family)